MDRIPTTPMNTAIVAGEKLMTCDRKTDRWRDAKLHQCLMGTKPNEFLLTINFSHKIRDVQRKLYLNYGDGCFGVQA